MPKYMENGELRRRMIAWLAPDEEDRSTKAHVQPEYPEFGTGSILALHFSFVQLVQLIGEFTSSRITELNARLGAPRVSNQNNKAFQTWMAESLGAPLDAQAAAARVLWALHAYCIELQQRTQTAGPNRAVGLTTILWDEDLAYSPHLSAIERLGILAHALPGAIQTNGYCGFGEIRGLAWDLIHMIDEAWGSEGLPCVLSDHVGMDNSADSEDENVDMDSAEPEMVELKDEDEDEA